MGGVGGDQDLTLVSSSSDRPGERSACQALGRPKDAAVIKTGPAPDPTVPPGIPPRAVPSAHGTEPYT